MDHLKTTIDCIQNLRKWVHFNEQFLPAVIEHKRSNDSQFSNLLEQLWGTERVLYHLSSSTLEAHWSLLQEINCVLGRAVTLVKEVCFKSKNSTSRREHDTGEHYLDVFLDLRWWTWVLIYNAPLRTASLKERFLVTPKGVSNSSSSRLPSFMQKLCLWWGSSNGYSRHLPSYGIEVFVQETEGLSSLLAWLKTESGKPLDTPIDICHASAELFIVDGKVLVPALYARKPLWVGHELKVDLTQVVLGMSNSGLVIKCEDSGTEYALKRVQNMDQRQPVIARLCHPHIVQLMSYWRENGFLFLMMELMEGDFKDLFKRRLRAKKSPFRMDVVLDILLQIAKAMLYLHDMGLTHPHLKSSDVLFKETADGSKLDKNDTKYLIKLSDFQFYSQNDFESMAQQNVYQFGLICLEALSMEPLHWELEERVMGMSEEPKLQFNKIQDRPGYAFPGSLTQCITRCLGGSIKFSEVVVMLLLAQLHVLMRATKEISSRALESEHTSLSTKETSSRSLDSEHTSLSIEETSSRVLDSELTSLSTKETSSRALDSEHTSLSTKETSSRALDSEHTLLAKLQEMNVGVVNPRDYLDKAQALAAMLPSEPSIKLHRRQCSCLQQKLGKTLELVVRRVASYNRAPVQYEKVFEEFHHLVQKVKTFVEDCCYDNEIDFVLAAIRVTAHRARFFQYHVELDWCSFLLKCLWEADKHSKPVYTQTLQKFDWEQKFKSLLLNISNMIAADEGELKALLESWIAKPGEHQAICWALLRRFGSKTDSSDLHILPSKLGFPPIPTTLGKFIGAGSFGHVHEIKWRENLFAVKYIPIGNVETINSEVKILEHCCHPHIVNLILAHKEDTIQYLMMERLSWDLQSYIDERKRRGTFPVPTSEAVDMISQICEALVYLNDPGRKVSHRDLKPRNILVKELKPVTELEIPAIELQVADFGVAKERNEKGPEKFSISENTPNCGVLLYRAPEMTGKPSGGRIRGSSMKADMYTFAVTCSFILTGTAPFSGYENRESLIQAVKDGARPHLPDNYPLALATLLGWCWHSDPSKRPESFYEILAELRKLKASLLTGAVEGVELPDTEAPKEPIVTFNPGDRRLNILILGDPESVEAVVSRICGARRRQTLTVQGHVNLTESRSSSPPMCLYSVKKGGNKHDSTDIRTFVKVRNEKWRPTRVEALWVNEVHRSGPRNWSALFPDSTSRLHMVWFVCRKLSDLPNLLEWPKLTESLYDLPVQILVIENQSPRTPDLNQQEFNTIFENRSDYFPNAQEEFMKELIVKVALQDDDLKGELWRKCWAVKTRVEVGNAAKIIREIRKRLGPAGKSVQTGVGGARMRKEVSLSRSGELVLHFLCAYWDIPQDSLCRVLQGLSLTTFISQARGIIKISIKPCRFVEFCLIVAAIILYNGRDNASNPKYGCSWNVSSESSLNQLLTEARECYDSYFASSTSLYQYDKMDFENIRLFLERISERKGWVPPPVGPDDRGSFISKIMKRLWPTRGKSVSHSVLV